MKVRRLLPTVIVFLLAVLATGSGEAANRQMLRHRLGAMTASMQAVDSLPATNRLHAALCLPLRNQAGLTNLLRQIYDPSSPSYHHYLTTQEFTEQFGPTKDDYAAVVAFAQAQGLKVTTMHPNRMLVDIEGATMDFERVFHTNLRLYRHPQENRTFYAPDTAPSLDLAVPILSVSGLDNYSVPHPAGLHRAIPALQTNPGGSGPGGNFIGYDFRNAYAPNVALTGIGQSVGLFELDDYYPGDITNYVAQANISSVPLQNILVDGGVGTPGMGNEEVALDIEMVISLAPGLDQVIVYEGPLSQTGAYDTLNRIANDNVTKQISSSWVIEQIIFPDSFPDQIYKQFAAQGQSFFQASGDDDAFYPGIFQYSDDPYITIVGGTTLIDVNGAWSSETVWNWGFGIGSGGGISTNFSIPNWQQGIDMSANGGSTTLRNSPDVAMIADNIWMVADNGTSGPGAGTSAAAPLWAAFTALINQQAGELGNAPVGFLNPAIYALGKGSPDYTTCFHDITTGDNTSTDSPSAFYAVPGYDLCTGWGTPVGQSLINSLTGQLVEPLGVTPAGAIFSRGPVGGPFSVNSQTYVLTNSGVASLAWNCSVVASWLALSAAGGTLLPGESTNVTVTVNAGGIAAGTYNATIYFTDATSAVVQNRTFLLQVGQMVENGGFETGDFTGWTQSGNLTATSVVPSPYSFIHSGAYGAELGPIGSFGYLSQTIPTVPGQNYIISFWLNNPSGAGPNEFQASWDGTVLFNQNNLGAVGWTNVQLSVIATGNTTLLQFGFQDDSQFLALDDVSVSPFIPINPAQLLTLTVQSAYGGASPGTVVVPYGTFVSEHVNAPLDNGNTQYDCYATVIGNAFTQTSPYNVTLQLITNATLIWNWQTQYYFLNTDVSGTGSVTPGGWQAPGTHVVLTATPVAGTHFVNWAGNTNGCVSAGNMINVAMTRARSITAVFAAGALPVISGKITKSGAGTGVAGVLLTFSNSGGTTTTDINGNYTLTMPYGWTGTVTPSTAAGGAFSPTSKAYSKLTANATAQNFTWIPPPVVSGKVMRSGTSTGLSGIVLTFAGVGTATTDTNGNYSLSVPYNWTGTVTPSTTAGGAFSPTSKAYSGLKDNATSQNYTWTPPPTISGKVTRSGTSTGVAGMVLTFSGVGKTNTDANGNYTMTVPYHWTGTATPSSPSGGTFSPTSRAFSKLIANSAGQNFVWTRSAAQPEPTTASAEVVTAAPVVLLRTSGSARWSGADAGQIRQEPELLAIAVQGEQPKITLPVTIATPVDLSTTVIIEPELQGVIGSGGTDVVVIRNIGGTPVVESLLPGTTVLDSVTLLPVGEGVVLTWDLTLRRP